MATFTRNASATVVASVPAVAGTTTGLTASGSSAAAASVPAVVAVVVPGNSADLKATAASSAAGASIAVVTGTAGLLVTSTSSAGGAEADPVEGSAALAVTTASSVAGQNVVDVTGAAALTSTSTSTIGSVEVIPVGLQAAASLTASASAAGSAAGAGLTATGSAAVDAAAAGAGVVAASLSGHLSFYTYVSASDVVPADATVILGFVEVAADLTGSVLLAADAGGAVEVTAQTVIAGVIPAAVEAAGATTVVARQVVSRGTVQGDAAALRGGADVIAAGESILGPGQSAQPMPVTATITATGETLPTPVEGRAAVAGSSAIGVVEFGALAPVVDLLLRGRARVAVEVVVEAALEGFMREPATARLFVEGTDRPSAYADGVLRGTARVVVDGAGATPAVGDLTLRGSCAIRCEAVVIDAILADLITGMDLVATATVALTAGLLENLLVYSGDTRQDGRAALSADGAAPAVTSLGLTMRTAAGLAIVVEPQAAVEVHATVDAVVRAAVTVPELDAYTISAPEQYAGRSFALVTATVGPPTVHLFGTVGGAALRGQSSTTVAPGALTAPVVGDAALLAGAAVTHTPARPWTTGVAFLSGSSAAFVRDYSDGGVHPGDGTVPVTSSVAAAGGTVDTAPQTAACPAASTLSATGSTIGPQPAVEAPLRASAAVGHTPPRYAGDGRLLGRARLFRGHPGAARLGARARVACTGGQGIARGAGAATVVVEPGGRTVVRGGTTARVSAGAGNRGGARAVGDPSRPLVVGSSTGTTRSREGST